MVLIFFAFFIVSLFQARIDADQKNVRFVIPKGQALSIIASRLEEDELIKSKWAFRFVVYKNNPEMSALIHRVFKPKNKVQ